MGFDRTARGLLVTTVNGGVTNTDDYTLSGLPDDDQDVFFGGESFDLVLSGGSTRFSASAGTLVRKTGVQRTYTYTPPASGTTNRTVNLSFSFLSRSQDGANQVVVSGSVSASFVVKVRVGPSVPTDIVLSAASNTSISVNWSPADGGTTADSFDVQYREKDTNDWTIKTGVTAPYIITGLDKNTDYEVQLRGVSTDDGAGAWSATQTGKTDNVDLMPTIQVIQDIIVIPGGTLDFTLPEPNDGDPPLTTTVTGLPTWATYTASTRKLSGTAPTTSGQSQLTYTATDDDGDTASRTFTLYVTTAFPSNVIAVPIDHQSVRVSWDPYPGAWFYQIRNNIFGQTQLLSQVSSFTTNIIVRNLRPATTYGIQVNARRRDNTQSDYSPQIAVTTLEEPKFELGGMYRISAASASVGTTGSPQFVTPPISTPKNVALTEIDHDTLEATWDTVPGAASYQGQYKKSTDTDWIDISGNITSPYRIEGLDQQTAYDFRVRATDADDESSSYSSAVSATTGERLLLLSDFMTPSGRTNVHVAMFERADHSAWMWRLDQNLGMLIDGEIGTFTRIRKNTNSTWQLNDTPNPITLNTFFRDGGDGFGYHIHIQDDEGVASFPVDGTAIDGSGGHFFRWRPPAAFMAVANRITAGERFIVAMTQESTTLDLAGNYDIKSTPTVTSDGAVGLVDPEPIELAGGTAIASASASLGTTGSPSLQDPEVLVLGGGDPIAAGESEVDTTGTPQLIVPVRLDLAGGSAIDLPVTINTDGLIGFVPPDPLELTGGTISSSSATIGTSGAPDIVSTVEKLELSGGTSIASASSSLGTNGSPQLIDPGRIDLANTTKIALAIIVGTTGKAGLRAPNALRLVGGDIELAITLGTTGVVGLTLPEALELTGRSVELAITVGTDGAPQLVAQSNLNLTGGSSIELAITVDSAGAVGLTSPDALELAGGSPVSSATSSIGTSGAAQPYTREPLLLSGGRIASPSPSIGTTGAPTFFMGPVAQATAISHNSILVSWSGYPGALSYDVESRTRGSTFWGARVTKSSASRFNLFSGLQPSSTHEYRLRARLSATEHTAWSAIVSAQTDPPPLPETAPNSPTAISLTTLNHESIQLSWSTPFVSANNRAVSYNLRYRKSGETQWIDITGVNVLTRIIGGLEASTTYEVQVQSSNGAGVSSWVPRTPSRTTTLEAPPPPPGIPTSIILRTIDYDSIFTSWGNPASGGDPTSFSVRYRIDGTTRWTTITGITGSSQQIDNLQSQATYEVEVQAVNISGVSAWTDSTPRTTRTPAAPIPPPGPPRLVTFEVLRYDMLRIIWIAPNTGGPPLSYNLRWRRSNEIEWVVIEELTGTAYNIDSLSPRTLYQIQVQSVNNSGTSNWTPINPLEAATPAKPPPPPGNPEQIMAIALNYYSVQVAWPPNDEVDSHSLRYRTGSGVWTEIIGISTDSRIITGLQPLTIYQIQIKAINAFGESEWSPPGQPVLVMTPPRAVAHIPDLVELDYQILIDWNGDGSFSHPLANVYGDVEKQGGVNSGRGRYFRGTQFPRAAAGQLDFVLRNDHGKFNPLATEQDSLGQLVETKKRVQVRVRPRR